MRVVYYVKTKQSSIPILTGDDTPVRYWIAAITLGFCGCLTTVSTYIKEIKLLSHPVDYIYAISSVLVTQVILLLIYGPYFWTR